ncbi:pilus assembly protein TadG-related protein [Zavarzinia aquatilis]|nr:pilus assembly protein TadG-related protein [Zavarzinia aquatilis]
MTSGSVHARSGGSRSKGERGAAALIFAVVLPILLLMVGFVVDFGYARYEKQRLQDSLDLAALAAARQLDGTATERSDARTAAITVMADNGFDAETIKAIEFGSYNRSRAILERFVAEGASGSASPTAVRITGSDLSPRFFSRIIATDALDVAARSTAVTTGRYTTVRIGSGLAGLSNGLLNAILGALLGSSVNLTALDYNGLLGANVDLLGFLDAYAVRAGLQVGDYDSLLGADVSALGVIGLVADLAQNAAGGDPSALGLGLGLGDAFPGISKLPLVNLSDVNVKLGDLLGVGLGTVQSGLATTLNVFDLVTAGIFAASPNDTTNATGEHVIAVSLGTFLGANLDISVVEGMQQRVVTERDIANGDNLLRTAQVRVLLQIDLGGPLGGVVHGLNTVLSLLQLIGLHLELLPGGDNLSVGVDVAPAEVRVTKLGCEPPAQADRYVRMNIDTGLLTAMVGQIDRTAFLSNNQAAVSTPLDILSLDLFGVPLLDLALGVNLPVAAPTYTDTDLKSGDATDEAAFPDLYASFSEDGHGPDNVEFPSSIHVGTKQIISNLGQDLQSKLGLQLDGLLGGLLSAILSPVLAIVEGLLAILGPILDGIVDLLLSTLGIRVGTADVAVINLECGNAKLVP